MLGALPRSRRPARAPSHSGAQAASGAAAATSTAAVTRVVRRTSADRLVHPAGDGQRRQPRRQHGRERGGHDREAEDGAVRHRVVRELVERARPADRELLAVDEQRRQHARGGEREAERRAGRARPRRCRPGAPALAASRERAGQRGQRGRPPPAPRAPPRRRRRRPPRRRRRRVRARPCTTPHGREGREALAAEQDRLGDARRSGCAATAAAAPASTGRGVEAADAREERGTAEPERGARQQGRRAAAEQPGDALGGALARGVARRRAPPRRAA